MNIKDLAFKLIGKEGQVSTSDIVARTKVSRAYAQRILKNLTEAGDLVLIGKANQAHYVLPSNKIIKPSKIHRIMINKGLSEDKVLSQIKEESSIFQNVSDPVSSIIDYAFTEMLNNAIEHSASETIDMIIMRTAADIRFMVTDQGIGIFKNIMRKKRLDSTLEAIQDLIKGKETTKPEAHSGEGIFFTSKIADQLIIRSFEKKLVFDNIGQDIYAKDFRSLKGTRVDFLLRLKSKNTLADLFNEYTDESFQFSKTGVKVRLFHQNVDYVSRSQARRILVGLEKFQSVELDFKDVETIGQAFADEIFRIWQSAHPDIKFIVKNANENIMLMIRRAGT